MSTGLQRKMDKLQQKLKARTRPDGTPRHGFEQNCAVIRAELEMISERAQAAEDKEYGE